MRDYICVKLIRCGTTLVSTHSESMAASKLDPGTCYGTGNTREEASAHAEREREKFGGGEKSI